MSTELKDILKRIEDNDRQIEILSGQVFSLNRELKQETRLLIDMIEKKNSLGVLDLEYVFLKLHIEGIKYHELTSLISNAELKFRENGEFPTFEEFHQSVIDLFSLTEVDQKTFTPEVTKKVLEKCM